MDFSSVPRLIAALRVIFAVVMVVDYRYGRAAPFLPGVMIDRLAYAVDIRVARPPVNRLPAIVGVVVPAAIGIVGIATVVQIAGLSIYTGRRFNNGQCACITDHGG